MSRRRAAATAARCCSKSDALFDNNVPFSEDFQMEVTHPAWRAPIRKGDRIRITGIYENKDHAWYDVMTHLGIYIDEAAAAEGPAASRTSSAASRSRRRRRSRSASARSTGSTCAASSCARPSHRKRKVTTGVDRTAACRTARGATTPTRSAARLGGQPCDGPSAAAAGPRDERGDDRQLPLPAGRPEPVRRGRRAAADQAGHVADVRQRRPGGEHPPLGHDLPVAVQRPVRGATTRSPTASGTRARSATTPIDGGSPNPVAQTPTDLDGRQVRVLLPHPPVDARRVRGRRRSGGQVVSRPPSTGSSAPVTYDDASLARKTAAATSSRASPFRPGGHADHHRVEVAVGVLVGHLGLEEAGRERVDADALAAGPLLGEVAGQADDRGLRRRVGGLRQARRSSSPSTLPMFTMLPPVAASRGRTPAPSSTSR